MTDAEATALRADLETAWAALDHDRKAWADTIKERDALREENVRLRNTGLVVYGQLLAAREHKEQARKELADYREAVRAALVNLRAEIESANTNPHPSILLSKQCLGNYRAGIQVGKVAVDTTIAKLCPGAEGE